uniref:Uncharacterized protein n=1 Tax=Arundo donax TaxID=35708 RepID=A0A0A8ZPR4_ARUDO
MKNISDKQAGNCSLKSDQNLVWAII